MNYREAVDKMNSLKLWAYDFNDREKVIVTQTEGRGFFFYHDAFTLRCEEWWFVYTEHDGYHCFHDEEFTVLALRTYKPNDFDSVETDPAKRNPKKKPSPKDPAST